MKNDALIDLAKAVWDCSPISGLTHCFYRYPARFFPRFVRTAIERFTDTGDVVFDPFMGGGTTLVEAQALKRQGIGIDINSLAVFVSRVKTTPLSDPELSDVSEWFSNVNQWLNLRNPPIKAMEWFKLGYQRNVNGRDTWPTRKIMELALDKINMLNNQRKQDFVRCVLLRTAQWAVDCREKIPSAGEIRGKLLQYFSEMSEALIRFRQLADSERARTISGFPNIYQQAICLNRSVVGIESDEAIKSFFPPRLILTSPPYPGVHVLYHRWQVHGARETPAPFWIAGTFDGSGSSHYTFGNRKQKTLLKYFDQAKKAYVSLAKLSDRNTLVVQLLAFSDPIWQLQSFIRVMEEAGFSEVKYPPSIANSADGRIWRNVPNRKFYADVKGCIPSSKEVLLIHKLK